ncbi:MAG: hypothetical protein ACRDOE_03900 [Streptosporangiaceae bacterium]
MSYDSGRPDLRYLRSRGQQGCPMGCGGTCPLCRPAYEERARRRSPFPLRPPERDEDRPPKDPVPPEYSIP